MLFSVPGLRFFSHFSHIFLLNNQFIEPVAVYNWFSRARNTRFMLGARGAAERGGRAGGDRLRRGLQVRRAVTTASRPLRPQERPQAAAGLTRNQFSSFVTPRPGKVLLK